jgi:signal transduction histidine kinase
MNTQDRLLATHRTFLQAGLGILPVSALADITAPDCMGYGTTLDEKMFSLADLRALIERQHEQSAGMEIHWHIQNIHTRIAPHGRSAFFADDLTLVMTLHGEEVRMPMRFTCVYELANNKWQAVHFHGSKPELAETASDTFGIDEWKQKAAELEQKVAERTAELVQKNRELEIEAALERVRARTMAMQKSDELAKVASLLFQQVKALGIESYSSGFTVWENNDSELVSWMCNADGSINPPFKMPAQDIEWHRQQYESWKKEEEYIIHDFTGKDMQHYYAYLRSFPLLNEAFNQAERAGIVTPERQVHHAFNCSHGNLLFITLQPIPEVYDVFKRFANVFDQTYTRFLDLQKAEAQAREAQIEAALERVRARAMAMQNSDELKELIGTIFIELTKLDIALTRCIIWVFETPTNAARWWMANSEEPSSPISFYINYHEHPAYLRFVKEWKKQNVRFVYDLKDEDKISWDHVLFNETELQRLPTAVKKGMMAPDRILLSASFNNFGGINVASLEPLSEEHFDILLRFANVFDQTYTRFLDLQKAEAQAREAQTEVALERVRSRSLAMQKSDEIQEVVNITSDKLKELGVVLDGSVTIKIISEDSKDFIHWLSAPDLLSSATCYQLPHYDHPIFNDFWMARNAGLDFFAKAYSFEVKNTYFEHIFEYSDYRLASDEIKKLILENDNYAWSIAINKHSGIFIDSITGKLLSKQGSEILKRFAKVFEQAYIRFLDLQKAEAQAREAQIEAALERVRSRTLAMHQTSELQAVIRTVHTELVNLNLSIYGGSFVVINEDIQSELYCWGAGGTANTSQKIHVPHFDMPFCTNLIQGIKKRTEFFTEEFSQQEKQSYFTKLFQHKPWSDLNDAQKNETLSTTGGYTRSVAVSKYTAIFIINEQGRKFTKDENDILKRVARVFDQTYTRFLDLQLKEQQAQRLAEEKQKLETTLAELRATQAQLIQKEKLASLGELTAGIAHEIQNPLNFVNNFSEVSAELVDELKEEAQTGRTDEVLALAEDLTQNLQKIRQHGGRASAIVRGMLEHSRASTGERQPTDLNALADEYLRLAYHGLRAKDKAFNVTVNTDFAPDLAPVNVVPGDIGRVLLNLLNNAFYAVGQRQQMGPISYVPTVWVRTQRTGTGVVLRVADNGTGIPEAVKAKIFQPFFTTKPTGQGTGLGLSLSYDIITKGHGGTLTVESVEGEGAEFIITL